MKEMKRRNRILFILSMVCLLTGSTIIGVGLALGGDIRYTALSKQTADWWPFSQGSIGMNLGFINDIMDETEFDKGSQNTSDKVEKSLDNVANLEVDIEVGNAIIQIGSENKVTFYNMSEDEWSIRYDDGETKVETFSKIRRTNSNAKTVIEVKAGELTSLDISVDVGNIEIHDQTLRVLDASCDVGALSFNNVISNNSKLSTDTGSISFIGELKGKTKVENDVGSVSLSLTGKADDYGYKFKSDMGEIDYNGQTFHGSNSTEYQMTKENTLDITCDMGSVEVIFL